MPRLGSYKGPKVSLDKITDNRVKKYHTDPEYRAKVSQQNRERYHRRIETDPEAAKIVATYGRIANARVSLRHHEERAEFFRKRLENDLKLVKKLCGNRKERKLVKHV